ncbi:hypothetical protein ACIRU3_33855 [Streptomyces sp. NPDC101151]
MKKASVTGHPGESSASAASLQIRDDLASGRRPVAEGGICVATSE